MADEKKYAGNVDITPVDISGIDKKILLAELHKAGALKQFGLKVNTNPNDIPDDIDYSKIDYFRGIAIKCDLSKNVVDPWGYNRDNSYPRLNAFQLVVNYIRSGNNTIA